MLGRCLCLANSSDEGSGELASSVKVTTFPVDHITLSNKSLVESAQIVVSCERAEDLKVKEDKIKVRGQPKIK